MRWILDRQTWVRPHIFQKGKRPYPIDHHLVEGFEGGRPPCDWSSPGPLSQRFVPRTSWIFHTYPRRRYELETTQNPLIGSWQSFYDGRYSEPQTSSNDQKLSGPSPYPWSNQEKRRGCFLLHFCVSLKPHESHCG